MTESYPNVRVRLRRTVSAPATATVSSTMVIYLRGKRFRVIDESGRPYAEIVADVTAARGFGATPQTMEDFMDAFQAPARVQGRPPTQLWGNLGSVTASVGEAGGEPWPVDPDRIVPVAEQILCPEPEAIAKPVGTSTVLGRSCTDYEYAIEGVDNGYAFRSLVRMSVSVPFVLVREITDATLPEFSSRLEVLELDEGAVTDADL